MKIKYIGETIPYTDPFVNQTIQLINNYIYEMAGIVKNNDTKAVEYICFNADIMIPYEEGKWEFVS